MKVLHVFISLPVGGAEDLVLSMVRHPTGDFQAEIICLKELGVAGVEAQREGLPINLLPLVRSKRIQLLAVLRLARWLRAQRVDVVHSHVYNAHVYAVLAARLAGIPVVMQHHKTFNRERRRRWLTLRILARWTHAQITLSAQTRLDLIDALRVSPQTCSMLSNVVDDSVFRPAADRAQARRAVGLDPHRPWIGGVASLTPQKNHTATVHMMAELMRQGCAAGGVICGEGLLRPALQAELDHLVLSECLRLVGNQRPIAPWLQAFDVLVLPSTWEGQPMVLLQALACETPVVASAIEGNIATLGADHPGLFALGDEAAYARLVRACVEDAAFRASVLAHQRQCRTSQPRFGDYLKQVAAIYDRLLPESCGQ